MKVGIKYSIYCIQVVFFLWYTYAASESVADQSISTKSEPTSEPTMPSCSAPEYLSSLDSIVKSKKRKPSKSPQRKKESEPSKRRKRSRSSSRKRKRRSRSRSRSKKRRSRSRWSFFFPQASTNASMYKYLFCLFVYSICLFNRELRRKKNNKTWFSEISTLLQIRFYDRCITVSCLVVFKIKRTEIAEVTLALALTLSISVSESEEGSIQPEGPLETRAESLPCTHPPQK